MNERVHACIYLWGGEVVTCYRRVLYSVGGCRSGIRSNQFLDFVKQFLVEDHTPICFSIEALNGEEVPTVDPVTLTVKF